MPTNEEVIDSLKQRLTNPWISREKFEDLLERIAALESQQS